MTVQWPKLQWGFKIQKHLKSSLFEGQISNGPVFNWSDFNYCYSYSPNHSKTRLLKNPEVFIQISNGFWLNGGHLSEFQMIGVPDFRSHSKYRPFATQSLFRPFKSQNKCRFQIHTVPHFFFFYKPDHALLTHYFPISKKFQICLLLAPEGALLIFLNWYLCGRSTISVVELQGVCTRE